MISFISQLKRLENWLRKFDMEWTIEQRCALYDFLWKPDNRSRTPPGDVK